MSESVQGAVNPADAAALMRYAGQPLEADRAADMATRLGRFREAAQALGRLIAPETEPIGLNLPRGR